MIARHEPAAGDVWASYSHRRDAGTHNAGAALDAVTRQYDLGDETRTARLIDQHVTKHQIAPRHAWWCPWHHVPLTDDQMCPERVAWPYSLDAPSERAQRRLDRMVGLVDAADRDAIIDRITSLEETPVHDDFTRTTASDVDHPAHYGGADDPYEPIKIIEAKRLGFHEGNALKYLLRAGHKPGESRAKDLRKAAWYLQRLADHLEEGSDE